mmetsp:Transcript_21546/g.50200  ORF Transcript_21546/g.50200 Transcript_21546/m.50200 type:complete len:229 (+) Transcript_21546:46-732(+)
MGTRASEMWKSGCCRCSSDGCFGAIRPRHPVKRFVPGPAPEPRGPPLSVQARIAARKGDPESLDLLPKVLNESLHGLDQDGRTLLFYAVRGTRDDGGELLPAGGSMAGPCAADFAPGCRQGDAARCLVEVHGFDVNYQVHSSGMTPLMEAARYANVDAARVLVKLGADRDLRNAKGHTAQDIAGMQLPEYLGLEEVCCSQNRWDSVKSSIDRDRSLVAKLLREAKSLA